MTTKFDYMWDDNPIDVSSEVNFIWNIANKLRGPYNSENYKDVIIPMTIIRRFECALEATKEKVLEKYKKNPYFPEKAMFKISGYQFFNTSEYSLKELLNDSDNLATNFKSYLEGFSKNVQNIVNNLGFNAEIVTMDKYNRLLGVIKAFSEIDLNPKTVDNMKMGYIFEELIRKFSENADAGDHYTGRDIIKTMVSLVLAEGCEDIFDDGKIITILDQAAGTGGMLSTASNYIHRFNSTADVRLFSQEINPRSYAMCLAEMLIRGQNADNIRLQDTMIEDCFKNIKMRFILENPPFGCKWGGEHAAEGVEEAVKKEALKGDKGRFPAGTPGTGDMQLLFIQSAMDKLDEKKGRAAIVESSSPLFSGGTSSGESQIRRYLLEHDYIEAIIQLNTDMFYNTGITTYIWILSKNKREERKGKVQLIDASSFSHKLRKSLGNKRNEITPEDRKAITELYANFEENEYSKIYENEEFMYREYTVMQPMQRSYGVTEERIENMLLSGTLNTIYDESKVYTLENSEKELSSKDQKILKKNLDNKPLYDLIIQKLNDNISDEKYMNPKDFEPVVISVLGDVVEKKIILKIMDGLSVMDKKADVQMDKKGNIIYDKTTKDTELVEYKEDIDTYMKREVLPYVPDAKAFFEEDLSKKKPVIKTGAEIPFTRYFYKYEAPRSSEEIELEFIKLENSVSERIQSLFGGK